SAPPAAVENGNAFDLLLGLFLVGGYAGRDQVHAAVPAGVLGSIEALGLLLHDDAAGQYHSPISLYPVGGRYFISDRWRHAHGSPLQIAADYVCPALHGLTHRFLELVPQDPCERLLDLCCGTGIAGLQAASLYARQVWAADITPRAALFAEFNRRLNGITN